GQDTCGRLPFPALIFFPRSGGLCLNVWGNSQLRGLPRFSRHAGCGMADMIPAEGKSATDQLPMPPDGLVTAHLVLRPAQRMFDVFVALLDPGAQPVEPDHLFRAGWREWGVAFHGSGWGR